MAQRKAAPLVGLVMGSDSDWEIMRHAAAQLDALSIPYEARVISACQDVVRRKSMCREFVDRKIDPVALGVFSHIPHDVDDLERNPQIDRVLPGARDRKSVV